MKEMPNEKIEKRVLEHLRALPRGNNAKLHELTEHVMLGVPKLKHADAYTLIGRLLVKLKRVKIIECVTGRGCGWRMS